MMSNGSGNMINSFSITSKNLDQPLDYHRRKYIKVNGYFKCGINNRNSKYNQWQSKSFHIIPSK